MNDAMHFKPCHHNIDMSFIFIPNRIKTLVFLFSALYLYEIQAKKFLDTYKSSIFSKILHIRQNKSLLCKAGECPLHFDTKLEVIG